MRDKTDLSRQVVRSEHATVKIPEIELEIPHGSSGQVTTVEGILNRIIEGLNQDQPVRKHMDPEGAAQIDDYVRKVEEELLTLNSCFHLILNDPTGNSFVENLQAHKIDPYMEIQQFNRSKEENHRLCIYEKEELREEGEIASNETVAVEEANSNSNANGEGVDLENEVLTFATNCPDCNAPAATNMKVTKIPFLKKWL